MFLFSYSDLSPAVPQRAVGAERCKLSESVEEGGSRGGGGGGGRGGGVHSTKQPL